MAVVPASADLFNKLPPQNLDAERCVLGSVLLLNDALDEIMDVIQAGHFYSEAHQKIFNAILRLHDNGVRGIDAVTLAEELNNHGELDEVGGVGYLMEVLECVPHAAHVKYYAGIVRDKWIQRSLTYVCTDVLRQCYEGVEDTEEILQQAEQGIFRILEQQETTTRLGIADILHDTFDRIDSRLAKGGSISGLGTGFVDLDKQTNGFQPAELIILAARPSMGKTALVCNISEAVADADTPVLIFSLEQSKLEIAERFLCLHARLDGHRMRKGDLDEAERHALLQASDELSRMPLFIDDQPGRTIAQIGAIARRLKRRNNIGMIIIDYLQLIEPEDKRAPREQQIAQITRRLKYIAKELSLPLMALAQLNRGVELREDKRPRLADLRECVTGDTLVMLADGRRVPIANLVGTTPEVLAMIPGGQLTTASTDLVWRVGCRPVFQVRLASGRSIRATAQHRLYGANGWVRVKELRLGDRLAIARRIPEPIEPEQWPNEHVALLGHLIGDGSYLSGQPLRYCTSSEINSQFVRNAAQSGFGVAANRHAGRSNWHTVVFSGNGNRWHPAGVNRWLRDLGIFNQRSFEKRIPEAAFLLSNRQTALLLRHLWATDGSITVRKPGTRGSSRIYFSTNSEGLARDVAALLLRMEIVARIRIVQQSNYRPMFTVDVSGAEHQRRFLEVVGGFGPREMPAVQFADWLLAKHANTNVDTLPREVFSHVRAAITRKGMTQRAMAAARGTSYGGTSHYRFAPSRAVIAQYAELLDDESLRRQASSDLFWDRIIEITPCGAEDVYDLTVPGPACWLADGIVSHNSGAIEQDADIVMFLHRPDAYNPEDRPGLAEVIVAKHRSGPTGIVNLTWLKESMRFADYSQMVEPPGGYDFN